MSYVDPFFMGRSRQGLSDTRIALILAKGQEWDSLGTPQSYASQLLQHSARLSMERGVPIGEDQIS